MSGDGNANLPSYGLQTDAKPFGVRFGQQTMNESSTAQNQENSSERCENLQAGRNFDHLDTEQSSPPETSKPSKTKEKFSGKEHDTDSENFKSYSDFKQSATHQPDYTINNISIVNSKNFQVGHTYYAKKQNKKCNVMKTEKDESPKNIQVRKGIFESKRYITNEDIYCVAERIGKDWRQLARFLPGNTFHNGKLDALESDYRGNLVETTYRMLIKWKEEYPEEATLGTLASTLWKTSHPDIVTHLKP